MARTRQHAPRQHAPPQPDHDHGHDHGPPQRQMPARGNQARQQQLQQQAQAEAARQTARQQFDTRYTEQRNQQVDATIPRWRQLSEAERDAHLATDPRTRAGAGTNGYVHNLNGQYWSYDVHANDPADPTTRGDLMGGNASSFYSRAFVTQRPGQNGQPAPRRNNQPINDVTVLNRDGTVSTLQSNDHGMVELPENGFGYRTHNRDDVTINGRQQPDQWGSPASIARNINIAADYRTMFPNSSYSIGDMSTDTGNSPLLYDNNPHRRHGTHYNGSQTDLQYINGEGSTNRASTADDNLFRQRSMIRLAENWGMDYFHVSPTLQNQLFFSPGSDVHYNQGHADHLHMGAGRGTQ